METKGRTEPLSRANAEIDLQWIFIHIILHWKWFLASLLICLPAGYLKLRYSTNIYQVDSKIVLQNSQGGSGNSEFAVFESMGLINSNNSIVNQMEFFHSRNLLENVVRQMGLYISYTVKGRLKDTEIYGNNNRYFQSTPVEVFMKAQSASSINGCINLKFASEANEKILMNGSYGLETFSKQLNGVLDSITMSAGTIYMYVDENIPFNGDHNLDVNIYNPAGVAMSYLSRLSLENTINNTSIVKLSILDAHPVRGIDFLNKLIDAYNHDVMDDKNKAARNALKFIEERLSFVNGDLESAEEDIVDFKRNNKVITSLSSESERFLSDGSDSEKQLVQIGLQLELLRILSDEIGKNQTGNSRLITNPGVQDASLINNINQYNALVLERERLGNYTVEGNPSVVRIEENISSVKESLIISIEGYRKSLKINEKDLKKTNRESDKHVDEFPRLEREWAEKLRQQKIKETLYVALLERKEEVSLSLAVTAPGAKVIESPITVGIVSPNRMSVMLSALLIGLLIPLIILGIKAIFNYRIENEGDVARISKVPVISSLPFDKKKRSIVISSHDTSPIAEMFRLLRTKLQFAMNSQETGKKVILITSFISGEGKTFVSINLAMTFALKYKTVLVGLDIRRPKLSNYMNLEPSKNGVVSYLSGFTPDINEIIQASGLHEQLDVIPAGMIPPDPNELLMEKNLEKLFNELRKRYEYIIVDTSPVGSVSDSFLLNRVTDISLFVVRSKYTPKVALRMLNEISVEGRLNDPHILINGISENKGGKYRYGYGYGYGYSYGYGYASEKNKTK